jgi:mRNA-degrading endonuclease YafQ of YafQ-DinJ toxin-antitoxin module
MTSEQAIKLLEEKEDEYMKDGEELIKGLLLLEKYKPIKDTAAQHDIIYVAEFNEKITKEDVLQLHRWGFHLDEEEGYWAYFT